MIRMLMLSMLLATGAQALGTSTPGYYGQMTMPDGQHCVVLWHYADDKLSSFVVHLNPQKVDYLDARKGVRVNIPAAVWEPVAEPHGNPYLIRPLCDAAAQSLTERARR